MKKLMITLGAMVAAVAVMAQDQEPVEAVETVAPAETIEVAAPVEAAEPVAEPVAETVETVEPAEQAPVEVAEPAAETVAETVETVEPVEQAPVEAAEPVAEPVAETVESVAEPVEAEPEDKAANFLELSLTLDVNSAYVSHNRIFSDTPVAQYDIWTQMNLPECFGWVAVDVWANQELQKKHSTRHENGGKQFGGIGEFDYEIVYGNSVGPVNLTASHLWYTYPRTSGNSQNFWTAGAEYENEIVVPSVKFYWEYMHHSKPDAAFMIDFALSRGFDITEKLSLKFVTKTTLYTAEYAEYISHGNLNKAVFGGWDNGVSLNYALTDNLSLGAHLNYLYKLDHRVRHCPRWDSYSVDNPSGSRDGLVYGGVSANLSF